MSCKHGNWAPCDECDEEDATWQSAYNAGVKSTESETARLREQLKVAVVALEFYANSRNWSKDSQEYGSEMSDYIVMWKDMREINQATRCAGEKAQQALALTPENVRLIEVGAAQQR
jgi:hypothetical protein